MESAAGVLRAVQARHQKRSDQRKADLAAVRVPSEHHIETAAAGPANLVGRMRQQNPQGCIAVGFMIAGLSIGAGRIHGSSLPAS